ncbi:hypothetical protein [Tsukamurella paurometabola]|nr:hypothetical protein [Tsukamurella paurometabola]
MMEMRQRRFGAAVGLVTVGVFVAACNGSSGGGASPSSASPSTPAAAPITTPVKELVLTASELPPGITAVPVTDDQIRASIDQMSGVASTSTITPAECGSATALVDATKKLDVTQLGMVAGSTDTGAATETVVTEKPDLAKFRANFSGKCNAMSARMQVQGQQVTTETRTTVQDAPTSEASDAVVLRQDTDATMSGGERSTQKTLMGIAVVRGYAVSVTVMGMTGEPDQALFDKLFTASVAKVAKG